MCVKGPTAQCRCSLLLNQQLAQTTHLAAELVSYLKYRFNWFCMYVCMKLSVSRVLFMYNILYVTSTEYIIYYKIVVAS